MGLFTTLLHIIAEYLYTLLLQRQSLCCVSCVKKNHHSITYEPKCILPEQMS